MRTVRNVHQIRFSTVNLLLHYLLDHAIGDLQRKNGLKWATGRMGLTISFSLPTSDGVLLLPG
jgi:hypothetical protein